MKNLLQIVAAALMAFTLALPALAQDTVSAPSELAARLAGQSTNAQACANMNSPFKLTEVSQADCCKGHKGVCGCRAGKIVCCDNTASPSCTCHGDSGIEN